MGTPASAICSVPQFFQECRFLQQNQNFFPGWTLPFVPDLVIISGFITKYGGAGVVSLMINRDAGPNYSDQSLLTTAGQGSTMTNVNTESTNLIRLGNPTAKGRIFQVMIGCSQGYGSVGTTRLVMVNNQIGSGDVTAPLAVTAGGVGEWSNITDPIKTLDLLTAGGQIMGAGSFALCQAWAH